MSRELLNEGDRLISVITPGGDHYHAGAKGITSIAVQKLPGPMGEYLVANIISERGPDVIIPLHAALEIRVNNP